MKGEARRRRELEVVLPASGSEQSDSVSRDAHLNVMHEGIYLTLTLLIAGLTMRQMALT